jgi:hypothetical protein
MTNECCAFTARWAYECCKLQNKGKNSGIIQDVTKVGHRRYKEETV